MAVTGEQHLEHLPPGQQPQQQQDLPEEVEPAARDAVDGNNGEKLTGDSPLVLAVWPPSQRAREAVIQSLAESLSSPSSLFKRYGAVPHQEAAAAARRIEQEAFAAVSQPAPAPADDDGMETLNVYSKEISKRVVDFCKARRAASSSPPSDFTFELSPAGGGEEAPPLESEAAKAGDLVGGDGRSSTFFPSLAVSRG